ncbi:adenylate/guanylate cyclase domain-containing protein [Sphingopyxis sp.]|uniref:adenylate/guanylate cyclase domain-containing protein n=1 Tax=Sphingopyxis sp. TaxID=1908224 RepID=UPI002B49A564|nr:adenylate/guanylate cyclase domain-containing protein [Sphingopyxis sp.]HJS11265.1 adenylate/guanylate cyclase domain-containing protein [Sphingopyxis sp.]
MTGSADPIAAAEAEVAHRLAEGDALSAFDCAAAAQRAGVDSPRLRYLLVRALAASGDSLGAMHLYEQLGLAASGDVDSLALAGRIWKDAAFDNDGDRRAELLGQAAAAYDRAWRLSGASFPAINAASLYALLGERERAAALAGPIAANGAADDYWDRATLVEALLLLNRGEEALHHAQAAQGGSGARAGDRASTCRQLSRLAASGAIDVGHAAAVVDLLRPPPVGVYCGRMFRAGGAGEANARAAIGTALDAQPLSAMIGPLACGADILFAEEALARGIDLTVVLPFAEDDFIAQSVLSGGEAWLARYVVCRDRAAMVHFASSSRYVSDDCQFVLGSHTMMGLAKLRARELETAAIQLAVVDPDVAARPLAAIAGTNADMALWQRHGGETLTISAGDLDRNLDFPPAPRPPEGTRRGLYAILFADFAGFSKLGEAELPIFASEVMGGIGRVLDDFGDAVLFRNTWGDAVYAIIDDPATAARIALAMQERLGVLPPGLGLDGRKAGMRTGIHFGPIYRGIDPVVGNELWYGTEVTRTARIEPVTLVGQVYCTQPLAAMLALHNASDFDCDYVGKVQLAKDYGELALYRLSRGSA